MKRTQKFDSIQWNAVLKHTIAPFILFCCFTSTSILAQPSPLADKVETKVVTSSDKGPDIDAKAKAASAFNSLPMFKTFNSFVSSSYALADTWIYADGDDELYKSEIQYYYPEFYKPTWGEVFDHVALQMSCKWSWNPTNRQFKFEHSQTAPAFGVELAKDWQTEPRGMYIWHAPKDKQFGMDIYHFGHYTAPANDPGFEKKVREHVAMLMIGNWPDPTTVDKMSVVKVAGHEALELKIDTPRPGGVWRQWSLVVDGDAFLIVSVMPKTSEAELTPAIEKMVASFRVTKPDTKASTQPTPKK